MGMVSLWCDFVERHFLQSEFQELIDQKVICGATSNPAIFKAAFLSSLAYREQKEALKGNSPKAIYEALAVEDIRLAAQAMLPLFEKGEDGFISIEVDPLLCDDAQGTIDEGKRLFERIGLPNVMIKVPATAAGFEAMEALMAQGIPVNATLIFSLAQSMACADAFEKGAKRFKETFPTQPLPKGVISIFVSRFDRLLDPLLQKKGLPLLRVGVMNALRAYYAIEARGLAHVRALFASTGVKGGDVQADYYIHALMVPRSINTAPLETIKAFMAHVPTAGATIPDSKEVEAFFAQIAEAGVDMDGACERLMREGLESFKEAFEAILSALSS